MLKSRKYKTEIRGGSSLQFRRPIENAYLEKCGFLEVNRRGGLIYTLFHGTEMLLLARYYAHYKDWQLRAYRWRIAAAEKYWQEHQSRWLAYLDWLDDHEVAAEIIYDRLAVTFTWNGIRYESRGFLKYETVPAKAELLARFDEFVDGLGACVP
ncbi:MAG TPA: hypothetical protein VGN12_24960 [Pirellulales bacterium]|jgi:hypothetical protein